MENTKRVMAILLALVVCAPAVLFRIMIDDHRVMLAVPAGAIVLWGVVRVLRDYPAEPPPDSP